MRIQTITRIKGAELQGKLQSFKKADVITVVSGAQLLDRAKIASLRSQQLNNL